MKFDLFVFVAFLVSKVAFICLGSPVLFHFQHTSSMLPARKWKKKSWIPPKVDNLAWGPKLRSHQQSLSNMMLRSDNRKEGKIDTNTLKTNAAKDRQSETVEMLDAIPNYYRSIFAWRGDITMVKDFLKEDLPADVLNYELYCAVGFTDTEIVELLLNHTPPADVMYKGGGSLKLAARRGNTELFRLLLERYILSPGAVLHNDDVAHIENGPESDPTSAKNRYLGNLEQFLTNEPIPNGGALSDDCPICGHICRNERLFLYLQNKDDPAYALNQAFILAACFEHIQIIELLLKNKLVDAHAENNFALKIAIKNGNANIVKLLLDVAPPADINDKFHVYKYLAIKNARIGIVNSLCIYFRLCALDIKVMSFVIGYNYMEII